MKISHDFNERRMRRDRIFPRDILQNALYFDICGFYELSLRVV